MTWTELPAWPRAWHEPSLTLTIADGSGRERLVLAPYPVDPGMKPALDVRVDRMVWELKHGALALRAHPVTVPLPDGTAALLDNGSTKGWRRRHRHGQISLHGTTYDLVHRGRRRTELLRDGQPLATVRRKGWSWASEKADGPMRHQARLHAQPVGDDLLALVLVGSALGPPGRPGWWACLFDLLSDLDLP